VFTPERLKVPLLVFVSEPAPEIMPEEVPAEMVAFLVEAIESAPPLRVEMVAPPLAFNVPPDMVVTVAAPVEVNVPAESVPTVEAPLTLTVPPEMELFNAPVTVTVPAEIPLVIVASLENAVVPAPERVVTVVAADVPVKFTLPALLTEATVRPVPETLAVALAATVSEAAELKSAAFKVPPLTVMPEVFTRDPAEVVRIPAVTVVAPE